MESVIAAFDKSDCKVEVLAPESILLKQSGLSDREFLVSVYADSRFEEMQQIQHWNVDEKDEFLRFQFNAQDSHYKEHYPDAEYLIIEHALKAIGRLYIGRLYIGRLYIERRPSNICIMDIAILRKYRRNGIARKLIDDVLSEAKQKKVSVNLHVEPDNVAKKLYLSLGFVVVGKISFYEKMEWCAQQYNS
jgi:ribosomal protein S18 acetylase RimI-like enzyme